MAQHLKNSQKKPLNKYARFSGMALQMMVIIGIGAFCGTKLDEKFTNKYKAFTVSCVLISIAVAMYTIIKKVTTSSNKKNKIND